MKINPLIFGILVLSVFFGIIGGFQMAGVWSVSGKVDSSGKAIQPLADDLETIKGWMTLEQITTVYQVPLDELLQYFNLPADTPSATALKDLESDTFDTDLLRTWLQARLNGTIIPTETEPSLITEAIPTETLVPLETLVPTEHVVADRTITGKTTFQDLIDWGLTQEIIERTIGEPMPDLSVTVKDYAIGKGLEFSTLKTLLQAEVDKLP